MTVTIDEVRSFLNNLPVEFVGPDAIQEQIDFAEWIVDNEKSSEASDEDIDMCVKIRAGFFVTLAYMEEAERALGVVPPNLESLARNLEKSMLAAMEYVKRGDPVTLKYYDKSESAWDYRADDNGNEYDSTTYDYGE